MGEVYKVNKEDVKQFLLETFNAKWDGKFYDIDKNEDGEYLLSEPKEYCGFSVDGRIMTILSYRRRTEPMGVCSGKTFGNVYLEESKSKGLYNLAIDEENMFLLTPLGEEALYYYTLTRHFKDVSSVTDAIVGDFIGHGLSQNCTKEWKMFLAKKYPEVCEELIQKSKNRIARLNNKVGNLLAEAEDLKENVNEEEKLILSLRNIGNEKSTEL